jgi:hypothetical protein
LLTAEELCSYSSKLCFCLLFTAKTGEADAATGEKDDSQRIGAFVVAKKEICDRILGSGIVDEDMKTSLTKELVGKRGSILEFEAMPDLESLGIDITLNEYEDEAHEKQVEEAEAKATQGT